jgi:hypothetical protein
VRLRASSVVVLLGFSLLMLPTLSTQQEVKAEIEINASADRVWSVLTDFSGYSKWNPYIDPAKGEAKTGAHLELTLRTGTVPITFQPIILVAQPDRELSWSGRLMGPVGTFERVQTFTIQEIGPHRVRLVSRELFRGLFLLVAGRVVGEAQRGLEMMVHALRDAAELEPPASAPPTVTVRTGSSSTHTVAP